MTGTRAVWATAGAFAVSAVAVWWLSHRLERLGVLDVPNQRSCHTVPVPRGGGLGLLAGVGAGIGVLSLGQGAPLEWVVLAGTLVIAGAGWADDLRSLPAWVRLLVQCIAAGAVVWSLGPITRLPLPPPLAVPLGLLAGPITLLWLVGVTNIYNFLDGIDGFAATQGLIAGVGLAVAFKGEPAAGVGWAVAAACLGFLLFNWHPARIFMGDVGAGALGFLLAATALSVGDSAAVWVMGMFLWFFLSDGSFTILRRLWQGERIWTPHRSHLYQRLVRAGLAHSVVVSGVAAAMVPLTFAAAAAYRSRNSLASWLVTGMAVLFFVVYWQLVVLLEGKVSAAGAERR